MIRAVLKVDGKEILNIQLEYNLPPETTKSDVILKAINNPYQIELEGGDLGLVQDTGQFVSFVLALIQKEPKCVSPLT